MADNSKNSVRYTQLDNGLGVLTDQLPTGNAAIGFWIHVGTRDEAPEASGAAHLVEHMLSKGTPARDAFQLACAFEDVGGRQNAHTSREQTAYYARVMPQDAALAVELFSDMLQHSLFDEDELARERDVIVQEIAQTYDQPDELLYDRLQSVMFPGQLFGRPILGDSATIATMPRDAVTGYVNQHYHAGNCTLVATGDIDHDAIVALAQKHCGRLPNGAPPQRILPRYTAAPVSLEREAEQVTIALVWPGVSYTDPMADALDVLAQALGEGFSSRLWQEVREKRGLVYSISAMTTHWLDAGLFGIYASATPDHCAEVLELSVKELARMAGTVTEAEIARAKAQLIANLTMDIEGTMERAEHLGHNWQVYGRVPSQAELTDQMAGVTLAQVQAAATFVTASTLSQGLAGPVGEIGALPNLTRLLAA